MRYNLLFTYHIYVHTSIVDNVCQSYFIFQNTHRIVTDITHSHYRDPKRREEKRRRRRKKKELTSEELDYTISSI